MVRKLSILALVLAMSLSMVACKKETPATQAGDAAAQAEKDAAAAKAQAEKDAAEAAQKASESLPK